MMALSEVLTLVVALVAVVALAVAVGVLCVEILQVKYLFEYSKRAHCPPEGAGDGVPVASCVVLKYVNGSALVEVYYVNATAPG